MVLQNGKEWKRIIKEWIFLIFLACSKLQLSSNMKKKQKKTRKIKNNDSDKYNNNNTGWLVV